MKLQFIRTLGHHLFLGALLPFLSGCTESPTFDVTAGSAKVQVPWLLSSGEPEIKEVQLKDLSSLRQIKGKYARFYMQPYYSGGEIQGQEFNGRFTKKDQTFYPTDVLSAQLSAVYVHFQELYALDQALGVSELQPWPRKVAVVTNPESSEVNGAFYDNDKDFYIFVPYTFSNVPVMANGGVIAHEHFHSHFSKLILNPLRAAKADGMSVVKELTFTDSAEPALSEVGHEVYARSVYQSILLRALNEGFADFWAFLYTQDKDFLLRSLPKQGYRSLKISDRPAYGFFSSSALKLAALDERFLKARRGAHISAEAYALGNDLAKKLIELTVLLAETEKISEKEASLFIAGELIQILPKLKGELLAKAKTQIQTSIYEYLRLLVTTEKSLKKPYLCHSIKETIALDGGLMNCTSTGAQ